ncbi:hypothetical protein SLEP1_g4551 [Rubroshorea leprosula]|uniref:Uncharacterized protein n=1 Tax=Rubroshorea leprosula TaxID=152421 RepID=A0AAV5HYK6_9ROSI|nr:hypothetical protein SLEP1_g4551 [Rubroshorea leprosula]
MSVEEKKPHKKKFQKWEKDECGCCNSLLNCLFDELYDYYERLPRKLGMLCRKNDTEEAGAKMYAGIRIDDNLKVVAIIDKLPPSSKEFQKMMRHKQNEIIVENLLSRIRVEEEARNQDARTTNGGNTLKVNFVATNDSFPKNNNIKYNAQLRSKKKIVKKNCGNHSVGRPSQNFKNQGLPSKQNSNACFVFGKLGHTTRVCKFRKCGPNPQVNITKEPFVVMLSDINMLNGGEGWWIDSGAVRHVCKDKSWFKTFFEYDVEKKKK